MYTGSTIPLISLLSSDGISQAVVTTSGAVLVTGPVAGAGSTAFTLYGTTGQGAVVTSSGALLISGSLSVSGTTAVNVVGSTGQQVVVTSSGALLISGSFSASSTVATNPWSSAPSFNIPMVSASSGLVQISGIPLVLVATSGATHLVQSTQATNPWSSAPGFNLPVLSVSSGIIQLSSAPLVIVASSGGTQIVALSSVATVTSTAATNPWSSAPGFNLPVVSVSSGLVQISGTPTVTATAATNPWSSAPGFNLPVVSVSSGLVQISGTATVVSASSGLVQALQSTSPWLVDISSTGGGVGGTRSLLFNHTSGGGSTPQGAASTSPVRLYNICGWTSVLSTVAQNFLQVYNVSSSAVTAGTTTPILSIPLVVFTSAAAGAGSVMSQINFVRGISCTAGLAAAVTQTATGATAGSGRFFLEYST